MQQNLKAKRVTAEKELIAQVTTKSNPTIAAVPLEPGQPLEVGDTVMILEPGCFMGSRGMVTHRNKGRGRVVISVGGMEFKMDRHLLGIPKTGYESGGLHAVAAPDADVDAMTEKERRLRKILTEELVSGGDSISKNKITDNRKNSKNSGFARTVENTLDLKTVTQLNEAQSLTLEFLKGAGVDQQLCFWLNHGIRNPVKEKYRTWLRSNSVNLNIRAIYAANLADGGDAVPVLER